VPDVYVFRKTADATLPTADAERRRQAQAQLDALEAFWSEWFLAEKGEFKAAFQNFPSTDAFEHQVELLLRQWLETRGFLGPRIAWPKEKGSPFRGLAPFEAEHAAVFFGRDRVIDEARRRFAEAAERGTPFLLIVGASGSGKSSLARAGLIPRLTTPGLVASVDQWRVARMKPSEGQAGPFMALATALLTTDALPELAHGDYPTAASLADNLRRGGSASVQPIISALARVTEDAQRERHSDHPPKAALVLLVDQFEELFAQGISDAERAAFAESLQQLIATGRVWTVATLRADLYELLLKQPALKALKEAGASLDLGPPGPAELVEIVLGNLVYIDRSDLPPVLVNRIARLAAFQNPEFYKAQTMRLTTFGTPRVISCAKLFSKHVALPRGCLDDLLRLLADVGVKAKLRDERQQGRRGAPHFCGRRA
jgi:hypothetical protein